MHAILTTQIADILHFSDNERHSRTKHLEQNREIQ